MTDGLISGATYNNNWAYPTRDLPGCFGAIYARAGSRSGTRVLALRSGYGLPAMSGLDFEGLFPVAKLTFTEPALPVSVSCRAFSPLIPHDVRNSSFPGAAFIYRISNTSGGDIEISIALAWENTLGVGGTVTTGPFDDRAGNTVAPVADTDGFFAERFARPLSKASSNDARLFNNASGEMTLMSAPGSPQAIVTTAAWDAADKQPAWWQQFETDGSVAVARSSMSARAHPAGVVAVRLTLRPREIVEVPFAVSWYTSTLNTTEGGDYGHYYQNVWPNSYAVARGLLTEWHSLLALTEEWQERIQFSNLPRWMARRLINSVAPITTHSIYTRDQTFALLDHIGAPAVGRPDSSATAGQTGESSPATADFGVGAVTVRPGARLTSLTHRLATSAVLTDLFPVLSARELRLFMARQATEGDLPATLGDIDRMIGVPQAGSRAAVEETLVLSNGPNLPLRSARELEDTASFVLQFAQYVLRTGDREFLQAYIPNVRRALALFLDNGDREGLPVLASGTLSPASSSLYIAALRSGAHLCRISGSPTPQEGPSPGGLAGALEAFVRIRRQVEASKFAARCEDAAMRAARAMDVRFWNGSFYADHSPLGVDACAIDQLIGVSLFDRMGGEGPAQPGQNDALPGARIVKALGSIERINDGAAEAPIAPIARAVPGRRDRDARDDRDCDVSASILGEATLALTRGQPEIAVGLLRRLDEARNNRLMSPWFSPDRFDAHTGAVQPFEGAGMAQAADWNTLDPLEGFSVDLCTGQLDISPQIPGNWRSLSAPIFAPTFWGRLEFRPTARGGITSLRVDRLIALPAATAAGRLSGSAGLLISRLRVAAPPPRPVNAPVSTPPVAHVSRGTTPLGVKTSRDRTGEFILVFETPVILTAGDRLEIDLH